MLRCFAAQCWSWHTYCAIVVGACYLITGALCLSSELGWREVAVLAGGHLGACAAGQRWGGRRGSLALSYVAFMGFGLLLIAAVWIASRGVIHRGFSVAVIGSVAWSIASWLCFLYLVRLPRRREQVNAGLARECTRAFIAFFAIPTMIGAVLGLIHVIWTSTGIGLVERSLDFAMPLVLGTSTGLLLAGPWLCVRWTTGACKQPDSNTHSPP